MNKLEAEQNKSDGAIELQETPEHSPLPWTRQCFLISSKHGDEVTHTGLGHLSSSRSGEAEANAAFIVEAVNSFAAQQETISQQRETIEALAEALRAVHACPTVRDDGSCDGCAMSEALQKANQQ